MAKNKSQYDSTLNLPKTLFEMRAGLPKKEPAMLEDWEKNDLYNNLIKHNDGKPKFVLHDGLRMQTATSTWHRLNKIIKDIIIRDKNMEGFQAPYVPGFDTHGLPLTEGSVLSGREEEGHLQAGAAPDLRKVRHRAYRHYERPVQASGRYR